MTQKFRTMAEVRASRRAEVKAEWEARMGKPWPCLENGEPMPVLMDVDIDWGSHLPADPVLVTWLADEMRQRKAIA